MSSPGNRAIDDMLEAVNAIPEPTSSVAVARARRELERQQDYQMFIRQEAPRIFAALITGRELSYIDGSYTARESLRLTNDLWNALPAECKL